jgi:hypothetical protein
MNNPLGQKHRAGGMSLADERGNASVALAVVIGAGFVVGSALRVNEQVQEARRIGAEPVVEAAMQANDAALMQASQLFQFQRNPSHRDQEILPALWPDPYVDTGLSSGHVALKKVRAVTSPSWSLVGSGADQYLTVSMPYGAASAEATLGGATGVGGAAIVTRLRVVGDPERLPPPDSFVITGIAVEATTYKPGTSDILVRRVARLNLARPPYACFYINSSDNTSMRIYTRGLARKLDVDGTVVDWPTNSLDGRYHSAGTFARTATTPVPKYTLGGTFSGTGVFNCLPASDAAEKALMIGDAG